jgi:hypothetical protein
VQDTTHVNSPLDTAHYRFASITIHGLSVLLDVDPPNDTVQQALERQDSLTFAPVSQLRDTVLLNYDTTDQGLANAGLYYFTRSWQFIFAFDTTNKVITLAEFDHSDFEDNGGAQGGDPTTNSVDYQVANIPYTLSANGSVSAHISLSSVTPHLSTYGSAYSVSNNHGYVTNDHDYLLSVDSVASGAFIDIELHP